jgi:hypothetical protein
MRTLLGSIRRPLCQCDNLLSICKLQIMHVSGRVVYSSYTVSPSIECCQNLTGPRSFASKQGYCLLPGLSIDPSIYGGIQAKEICDSKVFPVSILPNPDDTDHISV